MEDIVKKTAALEDNKFEFNTKENAVDYAYMTIAAVYVLGNPSSMSRRTLSSSAVETVVQVGKFALARREERIHGIEEACAGRNVFLALHSTDLPNVQWAEDEGHLAETIYKSNVESPELQDPVDQRGSHPGSRLRH